MNLTINISMDDAAFKNTGEVDEILRIVAQLCHEGAYGGSLTDGKGNTVGGWDLSSDNVAAGSTGGDGIDPKALAEYQKLWTTSPAEQPQA